jgi:hypothetical protein
MTSGTGFNLANNLVLPNGGLLLYCGTAGKQIYFNTSNWNVTANNISDNAVGRGLFVFGNNTVTVQDMFNLTIDTVTSGNSVIVMNSSSHSIQINSTSPSSLYTLQIIGNVTQLSNLTLSYLNITGSLNISSALYLNNPNISFSNGGVLNVLNGYLTNATLNTTTFWLNGTDISLSNLLSVPPDQPWAHNISKYLNVSNLGAGVFDLNISYAASDLGYASEPALRIMRYNGTDWVGAPVSGVDTANKKVWSIGLSSFGPVAPMAGYSNTTSINVLFPGTTAGYTGTVRALVSDLNISLNLTAGTVILNYTQPNGVANWAPMTYNPLTGYWEGDVYFMDMGSWFLGTNYSNPYYLSSFNFSNMFAVGPSFGGGGGGGGPTPETNVSENVTNQTEATVPVIAIPEGTSIDSIFWGRTANVHNYLWCFFGSIGFFIICRKNKKMEYPSVVLLGIGISLFLIYDGPTEVWAVASRLYW